ncbi:MAG: hypothetical protein K9L28_08390 [Synergistales bacterium]|nr:hypothetical protein [Synergistales bacterium]
MAGVQGGGSLPPEFLVSSSRLSQGGTEDSRALKKACQEFEGILLAMLWKDMYQQAESLGGEEERGPFAPLEETSMEMAAHSLSRKGGVGLWKVLYDQLQKGIPETEGDGS